MMLLLLLVSHPSNPVDRSNPPSSVPMCLCLYVWVSSPARWPIKINKQPSCLAVVAAAASTCPPLPPSHFALVSMPSTIINRRQILSLSLSFSRLLTLFCLKKWRMCFCCCCCCFCLCSIYMNSEENRKNWHCAWRISTGALMHFILALPMIFCFWKAFFLSPLQWVVFYYQFNA